MVMFVSDTVRAQSVDDGSRFEGVVYVSAAGAAGSGTLLYDGRAILTAAHVVTEDRYGGTVAVPPWMIEVRFETAAGTVTIPAETVTVHPQYDPNNVVNDVAIIWLSRPAPAEAVRHALYRDDDELGQTFTLVGYGNTGTGLTGEQYCETCLPQRHYAENRFDITATALKEKLGYVMDWTPRGDTQLMADFDDGTWLHDALGRLAGVYDTGLGAREGLIASGDSGGPALIEGQVAGIASYGTSLYTYGVDPDIDDLLNASFGEIAAWQRVSAYQQWIDQQLRAHYEGAPRTPEEVSTSIREGDGGLRVVWFLLQFNGERESPDEVVSVHYRTVDGTAVAGEDYVPVSGQVNLYPGEDAVPIPVEVIGDRQPEPEEVFYLEIYDPSGGSFGEGVETLRAARVIVDDDGYWLA